MLDYHLEGLFQSGCVLFSFILLLNILDNMDFIIHKAHLASGVICSCFSWERNDNHSNSFIHFNSCSVPMQTNTKFCFYSHCLLSLPLTTKSDS